MSTECPTPCWELRGYKNEDTTLPNYLQYTIHWGNLIYTGAMWVQKYVSNYAEVGDGEF